MDPVTEINGLRARIAELEALINTPATADFLKAVELEAAHQIERWGKDARNNDEMKDDADWLWLMAYLSAKAVFGKQTPAARTMASDFRAAANWMQEHHPGLEDLRPEKRAHRIIAIAAAALNWHRNQWPGKSPGSAGLLE